MKAEILRPGRTEWESGVNVPMTDVVGSLVRYEAGIAMDGGPAYIVCRVVGLDDAPGGGKTLRMEINTPEGAQDA